MHDGTMDHPTTTTHLHSSHRIAAHWGGMGMDRFDHHQQFSQNSTIRTPVYPHPIDYGIPNGPTVIFENGWPRLSVTWPPVGVLPHTFDRHFCSEAKGEEGRGKVIHLRMREREGRGASGIEEGETICFSLNTSNSAWEATSDPSRRPFLSLDHSLWARGNRWE